MNFNTAANPQQYDSMVFQDLIRSASEAFRSIIERQ
jgi:hypothetical protein